MLRLVRIIFIKFGLINHLGRCDCILEVSGEATGLFFNEDLGQCACAELFEFLNPAGICRSYQEEFYLSFLQISFPLIMDHY